MQTRGGGAVPEQRVENGRLWWCYFWFSHSAALSKIKIRKKQKDFHCGGWKTHKELRNQSEEVKQKTGKKLISGIGLK
ncbi:unnamed protein product [Tenebrio molitor]|jgi:hypothetical protein|nr:unnamed protein product [Tenebrio molitor]